jgi:hypothetical protein
VAGCLEQESRQKLSRHGHRLVIFDGERDVDLVSRSETHIHTRSKCRQHKTDFSRRRCLFSPVHSKQASDR